MSKRWIEVHDFPYFYVITLPSMLQYRSQNNSSVPRNQNSQASSSSRNSAYGELKLNRLWPDENQALFQKVIMDRHQMANGGENKSPGMCQDRKSVV